MGLYDNLEYRQRNKAEFDLKNASESAEDAARLRQEFDDKLSRVANTLAHGVTVNEINGVFSLLHVRSMYTLKPPRPTAIRSMNAICLADSADSSPLRMTALKN